VIVVLGAALSTADSEEIQKVMEETNVRCLVYTISTFTSLLKTPDKIFFY
jgi:hypothetical protein